MSEDRVNREISEVLQHVILAKKSYKRCLRDMAPVLYVNLVRKPRKLGSLDVADLFSPWSFCGQA